MTKPLSPFVKRRRKYNGRKPKDLFSDYVIVHKVEHTLKDTENETLQQTKANRQYPNNTATE